MLGAGQLLCGQMVFQRIRVVRRTPSTGCLNTQGARLREREEGEKEAIPRVALIHSGRKQSLGDRGSAAESPGIRKTDCWAPP